MAPIYNCMQEYGQTVAPLNLIGMFLNYAGNHLLHYISTVMKRKIFFPSHRVVGIQLVQSGEVVITAIKQKPYITLSGSDGPTIRIGKETTVTFRAKGVIISNGGKQLIPPPFYKDWFPFLAERKESVVLADSFLRKETYLRTMEEINQKKLKNIVIIGASHSGVSSAWLMLYGPATYARNNSLTTAGSNKWNKFPDSQRKSIANCEECCDCSKAKRDEGVC